MTMFQQDVDHGVIREVAPLGGNPRSRGDAGDPSYTVLGAAA